MTSETKVEVFGNLAWGTGLVILALFGQLARKLGYLDQEALTRLVIGAMGLMISWQGNRMPKAFVPNRCARQARRFAGWSMTSSGLIYTALFVLAPLHDAFIAGPGAIVTGILLTLAYCLSLRSKRTTA